jgi:putative transposase
MRGKKHAGPTGRLSLMFPKFVTDLPQFWQPRFYDFNVFSHEKKKEKLEYMHANPVVRGLVENPKDWLWSSFSFYAKDEAGLVEIDTVNL